MTTAKQDTVLNQEAYILFYARVSAVPATLLCAVPAFFSLSHLIFLPCLSISQRVPKAVDGTAAVKAAVTSSNTPLSAATSAPPASVQSSAAAAVAAPPVANATQVAQASPSASPKINGHSGASAHTAFLDMLGIPAADSTDEEDEEAGLDQSEEKKGQRSAAMANGAVSTDSEKALEDGSAENGSASRPVSVNVYQPVSHSTWRWEVAYVSEDLSRGSAETAVRQLADGTPLSEETILFLAMGSLCRRPSSILR